MKSILGRKVGMTQVFDENGIMVPVTVVEVLPNTIIQIKTMEKDGYSAIQVGYEEQKENKINKPKSGIFKKAQVSPKRYIREFRVEDTTNFKVGETLNVDMFEDGEIVDVCGTSKGKGFTGHIKRWNHTLGPKTHGSQHHRAVGSLASGITASKIYPGEKMAGRHGHFKRTILNLEIVKVDKEKNAILIKGAIPGPKKSLVTVRNAIKNHKNKKKDIRNLVDYSSSEKN